MRKKIFIFLTAGLFFITQPIAAHASPGDEYKITTEATTETPGQNNDTSSAYIYQEPEVKGPVSSDVEDNQKTDTEKKDTKDVKKVLTETGNKLLEDNRINVIVLMILFGALAFVIVKNKKITKN